jgi:hypothetical protein
MGRRARGIICTLGAFSILDAFSAAVYIYIYIMEALGFH